MKILVTGAAGFLGQQIVRSLLRQGCDDIRLHVRHRPPAGLLDELRRDFPQAQIDCRGANLLSRDRLAELLDGVGCVVHAAAGMRGAAADIFANSVLGTRNVVGAAVAAGVRRIVLVSSFSVYRTEHLPDGALLDESVEIEPVGVQKGSCGFAKTRQERLFLELQAQHGFESVILRPGVIYGPGGGGLSPRVGIQAMGFFFALGGSLLLPLTYVENCADAIALAADRAPSGSVFNVVDDDLPTCKAYLRAYRRDVKRLRVLPVPRWAFRLGARWLQKYHAASKGQLPAVFTPYIVRSMYRPLRYSNDALKRLGWAPRVPTAEGMRQTFDGLRKRGG